MTTKLVAWAPDPEQAQMMTGWGGTADFGAVLAPPGKLTMRDHEMYLADRVQTMLEAEDDPEASLHWAIREVLSPAGLVPVEPPLKGAGSAIVAGMASHLLEIGVLTHTTTVPTTDDESARAAMEEMTFETWIEGVTPAIRD